MSNKKSAIQRFLIAMILVSITAAITCFCIRQSTNIDYSIEKGNAITASYYGYKQDDKFNQLDKKRKHCVIGMIISGVVFFICAFTYPATKSLEDTQDEPINTENPQERLEKLNQLLESKVISKEEYNKKYNEIQGIQDNEDDENIPLSEQLNDLKTQLQYDVITQEEYDEKRKEILNNI